MYQSHLFTLMTYWVREQILVLSCHSPARKKWYRFPLSSNPNSFVTAKTHVFSSEFRGRYPEVTWMPALVRASANYHKAKITPVHVCWFLLNIVVNYVNLFYWWLVRVTLVFAFSCTHATSCTCSQVLMASLMPLLSEVVGTLNQIFFLY